MQAGFGIRGGGLNYKHGSGFYIGLDLKSSIINKDQTWISKIIGTKSENLSKFLPRVFLVIF